MSDEALTPPAAPVAPTHHVSPLGVVSSPTIGKLATALAKFQGEVKNPPKSKEANIPHKGGGGSHGYKYADFAESLELIRPVLASSGLSFLQLPVIEGADLNVVTRLLHESGEWIESTYPVGVIGDHRTMGGALTYAKRYALFAIIGVSGDDDLDGEPEVTAEPTRGASRNTSTRKAETPKPKNEARDQPAADKGRADVLPPEQSARAAAAMCEALSKCQTRNDELTWAKDHTDIKASLHPVDAKTVTDAFTAHQRARRDRETAAAQAAAERTAA